LGGLTTRTHELNPACPQWPLNVSISNSWGPFMKTAALALVGLLFCVRGLAGEESKPTVGSKELRNECHAYFYYTTALAEEASKPRMELLSRAIELDPRMARAFYNRGSRYFDAGDLPRARADFKKAVDLDENYINAHYNLACVDSMDSRPAEALASLEKALAKGYQKIDKIPNDPDFKNIKENPAFAPLIAKYQARAATAKLSARQRFQTSDLDGRRELLADAIREPAKQGQELALWAMHEPDVELRVLSMQLWRKLDVAQSRPALLRGLYDNNGYVNKAAGNSLASYGKDIEPLMVWVLEDKDTEAPFYAMQILAIIGAQKAEDKVAAFLRDDDPTLRITAAECLARLRAVSALPQLQAALQNLPKDKEQQENYKATLNRVIAVLKEAKAKGGT
jgi:tetratricopeptide (TPR) repeat protein